MIVTKEVGSAGVYRTAEPPDGAGPTPLELVGQLSLPASDDRGRPDRRCSARGWSPGPPPAPTGGSSRCAATPTPGSTRRPTATRWPRCCSREPRRRCGCRCPTSRRARRSPSTPAGDLVSGSEARRRRPRARSGWWPGRRRWPGRRPPPAPPAGGPAAEPAPTTGTGPRRRGRGHRGVARVPGRDRRRRRGGRAARRDRRDGPAPTPPLRAGAGTGPSGSAARAGLRAGAAPPRPGRGWSRRRRGSGRRRGWPASASCARRGA